MSGPDSSSNSVSHASSQPPPALPASPASTPSALHDDLASAARELRAAIIAALAAVPLDPGKPTELSKRLGLDKSLAWKLAQVAQATEPAAILEQVPGTSALGILERALTQRSQATPHHLQRLRTACERFESAVETHAGDRATLELLVDSLAGKRKPRLETSRRLAFRGNSGVWGVQARARVNTVVLTPNAEDPDWCDATLLGGWLDFKRLRSPTRWPLFQTLSFHKGSDPVSATQLPQIDQPLDPSPDPATPLLLRDFCSASLPEITAVREGNSTVYRLEDGPVGNTGAFTCYLGSVARKLGPRNATASDDTARFFASVTAPVEAVLCDLLIHHRLAFPQPPTVAVFGSLTGPVIRYDPRDRLPVDDDVLPFDPSQPLPTSPHVPDYARLLAFTFARLGVSPTDFTGFRYTLDHPPFPSTTVLSLPLRK